MTSDSKRTVTEESAESSRSAEASFAETALRLGGKSAEEARRTGAVDTADDQVEALFAPQYQTVNSPVHRAVWERGVPIELFSRPVPPIDPEVEEVMERSLSVVRRHVEAGTLLDEKQKVSDTALRELAEAGYCFQSRMWSTISWLISSGTGPCSCGADATAARCNAFSAIGISRTSHLLNMG